MNDRSLRIKALVEESGLSYQDLHKKTGISKSSLQRYASGETAKIPIPAIEKIALAFGVDPRYILGWEEEQKKNDRLATIVLRLRSDSEFMAAVDAIYDMEPEKLSSLLSLLK